MTGNVFHIQHTSSNFMYIITAISEDVKQMQNTRKKCVQYLEVHWKSGGGSGTHPETFVLYVFTTKSRNIVVAIRVVVDWTFSWSWLSKYSAT